ncbi:hypothetical protein RFI_04628, partial [Reticulomyxa filosa]
EYLRMAREATIDKENLDYLNHHGTFYICNITDNLQYWIIVVEMGSFVVYCENSGLPSHNTLPLCFPRKSNANLPCLLSVGNIVLEVVRPYYYLKKKKSKNNGYYCCGTLPNCKKFLLNWKFLKPFSCSLTPESWNSAIRHDVYGAEQQTSQKVETNVRPPLLDNTFKSVGESKLKFLEEFIEIIFKKNQEKQEFTQKKTEKFLIKKI